MKMPYPNLEKIQGRRRTGFRRPPAGAEADARKLLQELHLHKIELEMQSEELLRAQTELKETWTRIDQRVVARTMELTRALESLSAEVQVRFQAEQSLHGAFDELEAVKERLLSENAYLQDLAGLSCCERFPGPSPAMAGLKARIEAAAAAETPVLVLGEAGTGKGAVARAIHCRSARRHRPMVLLDCTSVSPERMEAVLFGKGRAGSAGRRVGQFQLASQGTLFLSEIALLPLALQARVLEAVRELGTPAPGPLAGNRPEVRIIASSNRDLQLEVGRGRFREDLHACLAASPIRVPPLREHREDIPSLVELIMAGFNRTLGKDFRTVSQRTLGILLAKAWPGNVRELKHLIELTMIATQGPILELPPRLGDQRH